MNKEYKCCTKSNTKKTMTIEIVTRSIRRVENVVDQSNSR